MVLLYEIVRNYIKDGKGIIKVLISTAIVVSQPMLYSIERGNTIIMTLLFVLIFILYYDSDNKILKELALISLAIAASLKMTPALLGVLLLYNKQWKEAVRTVIYGVVIFLLPFLFFKGGFDNIALMIRNMKSNLEYYTSESGCTLYASLINYGFGAGNKVNSIICDVLTKILSIFLLATAIFYEKKWKKVLCACVVLVVLPSHSGYYCILYLIPAILLFLNEKKHEFKDYLYLLAFLIIMCDYGASAAINYHLSILMILLLIVVESSDICIGRLNDKFIEKDRIIEASKLAEVGESSPVSQNDIVDRIPVSHGSSEELSPASQNDVIDIRRKDDD